MIKDTFSKSAIRKELEEKVKRIDSAIIYALTRVGEQSLEQARLSGSYKDQTGNLRSSTGFAVLKDGEIVVQSSFERVMPYGNWFQKMFGKDAGKIKGQQKIEEIKGLYPNGYVLIVVAGMEYAGFVMRRGYDVLDSAWLKADEQMPKQLKMIKDEVQNWARGSR